MSSSIINPWLEDPWNGLFYCLAIHLKGLQYEIREHGLYSSALFVSGKERDLRAQTNPWNIIYSYDNTLLASNCPGELRHIRDRTPLVTHDRGELRHIRDRTFLAVHCRNESRLTSGTGPWKLLTAEASWDLHKDTKIMEIQTHPDRLCGPPSSLYNGHQEYFLGVKRPEHDVDQYPPYRAEFQTE